MIKEKNKTNILPRFTMLFFVLCLILLGVTLPTHAKPEDHRVRVGCFPLNGFFNIAEDGTVSGYGADYTEDVFSYMGREYEYVNYSSWVEALDALSQNEIDILAPAQHTPEREEVYSFDSYPIGTEYGALLTLNTNESLIYEDYNSFNQLNVGVVDSLIFLDDFKDYEARKGFSVNFHYFKDTPELIEALNSGKVDAILANMMVKTDSMKLLIRFGSSPMYYMLSKNASGLAEELNQAIDNLTSEHPELQNNLSNQYFSDFEKLPFSKQELDYISEIGTLKVACDSNYTPFSYVNEKTGQIEGVSRAIMEEISKLSGLKFEYVPTSFDDKLDEFAKEHQIGFIAGVENDQHTTLHDANFSEGYLTIQKYFYGKKKTVFDSEDHLKVATLYSSESQITTWKNLYPNFEFIKYESIEDCVDSLHDGNIDLILEDRYSMENVLASPRNKDIKLLPVDGVTSNICFKVLLQDDNANLLTSILNKSIHYISEKKKETILNEFVQKNQYHYTVSDFVYQYRIQIFVAILVLIVIGIAIVNIYKIRRKAQIAIEENEMKLRHITNNIRGGVIVLKANQGLNITFANDGFLQLIGCSREEFEEKNNGSYLAYVHKDDLEKLQATIDSDKYELSMELRVMKADGDYVHALFNCTTGQKVNGEKELYCVIIDMTEQNRLLEELRIDKRRTELILNAVTEVFYEVNCQTGKISTSPSFEDKFGWTLPDQFELGTDEEFKKMWHAPDDGVKQLHHDTLKMLEDKKASMTNIKLLAVSSDQTTEIWCQIIQHPIIDKKGTIVSVIGLVRDVHEQMTERERLIKQAQTDPLTGLLNKEAFEIMVTDTLKKRPDKNHAVIFVDLDHFKSLNDTIGHLTGDHAICEAADKLRVLFPTHDIVSRFGGDEFCIFVKNISLKTLRDKMDWLIDKLREDYHGEKGDIHITCSCGIACTALCGYEYQQLMHFADEALYYSKESGRDRYTFYQDIQKEM